MTIYRRVQVVRRIWLAPMNLPVMKQTGVVGFGAGMAGVGIFEHPWGEVARGLASATIRALLQEQVAWAHARAGEIRHIERALSAVDTEYDQRRPTDDPEWVYWLDSDEIAVMAGRCYVELGQTSRAIPLLTEVLERYDERQPRESALYTSWLAEAHVQAGDVEHAAALAERTLELSNSTSSSR